jgi:type IV pilus assembly protein PilA
MNMRCATSFLLLSSMLVGCGPKAAPPVVDPRARYLEAVNARLSGDSAAYYGILLALAKESPDSRAGRRARATLSSSNVMTQAMVVGTLSAIAIPNFIKYQHRAKQAEAKLMLGAVGKFEERRRSETQSYGGVPADIARGLEATNYFCFVDSERPIAGPHGDLTGAAAEEARLALDALGLEPHISADNFLAVAIGNLDDDPEYDVWIISEDGTIVHFMDDLQ